MVAIFGMFFQSGLNGTLLRSFAAALVRERAGREGAVLMVAIIGMVAIIAIYPRCLV